MARRKFRYDKATDAMVEVSLDDELVDGTMVRGDMQDFVSPIDGTLVSGASAYREHMRRHDVVPFEAGMERRAQPKQADKQARREAIWEGVDRAIQRKRR